MTLIPGENPSHCGHGRVLEVMVGELFSWERRLSAEATQEEANDKPIMGPRSSHGGLVWAPDMMSSRASCH